LNDLKKAELYEHLFKSLEAGLGVSIEEVDPVEAFYERCDRGEYDPNPMSMMVSFVRANGDREKFLTEYPEELRNHLYEICEKVKQREEEIYR
jgi:L-fucose isomerase-like protein